MDMKTLADFKRILAQPGCTVTVLRNDWLANRDPKSLKPWYFEPRTVGKLQGNAVAFNTTDPDGRLSWFWFPKAKCVRAEGDTITFCMKQDGTFDEVLVYRVAVPAEVAP